jgi:hypothetical protein
MAIYPVTEPMDEEFILLEDVQSDQSELGSAIGEMASATGFFIDGVTTTLDGMLASTITFAQEINGYELAALVDGIDISVQTPTFQATNVALVTPTFNGSPPTFVAPVITATDPPDMNLLNPDINIPPVPNLDIPAFNEVAPVIDTPILPPRPTYTLPPMPSISDIAIPVPPTYNIPDFEGAMPVFDMTPPEGGLDWAESAYNSQLKTQIDGRLATDVTTDRTGLEPIHEDGIYDRARSRQEDEHARGLTEGSNFFESRGIMLPAAALSSIQTEVANRIFQVRTDLENDIDIQGAKLTDEHARFVKGSATDWEKVLISHYDKAQDRALEAAKAVIEIMIVVYQTKVEGYKAQMAAYSSMADAYNSRINAELGKAEFYKAQIEGVKLTVEVQSSLVDAYTAQVQSLFTIADIYSSEMQAARIQAEIDKIKMEAYSVQVKAYRYQIEALAARYQVYLAQIQGEEAKVKMYQSLVEAYEAQVEGHVARARVLIAGIQIQVEDIKAQAQIYAAQVRKFQADTKATIGHADIRVVAQSADNTDYDARTRPQITKMSARGKIENASAHEMASLENATARMSAAVNKASAQLREIHARTSAVVTRGSARRAASKIAAHSESENWSKSDAQVSSHSYARSVSRNSTWLTSLKDSISHITRSDA